MSHEAARKFYLRRLPRQSWLDVGLFSQIDSTDRVLFTADAHRDNGKRFIVSADEKLTAFLELERITYDDSD